MRTSVTYGLRMPAGYPDPRRGRFIFDVYVRVAWPNATFVVRLAHLTMSLTGLSVLPPQFAGVLGGFGRLFDCACRDATGDLTFAVPTELTAEQLQPVASASSSSSSSSSSGDGDEAPLTHVKAHKLVLIAQCDYFGAMFSGSWSESAASVIALKDISAPMFKALLRYLYTG